MRLAKKLFYLFFLFYRFRAVIGTICPRKRRVVFYLPAYRAWDSMCLFGPSPRKMPRQEFKFKNLHRYWASSFRKQRKNYSGNLCIRRGFHDSCVLHHLIARQLNHGLLRGSAQASVGQVIDISTLNYLCRLGRYPEPVAAKSLFHFFPLFRWHSHVRCDFHFCGQHRHFWSCQS